MIGRLTGIWLLAGALLLGAAPADAATRSQKITLSVNRTTVVCGGTITLTGTTKPVARKRTVQIQQRYTDSPTWRTVKRVTTSSKGTFSTKLTLTSTRPSYFRVYLPARAGYKKAYSSRTARITVQPKPQPASPGLQAVSLGIENIVNPQDWDALRRQLDASRSNTVHLAAGRVEWTAFDWPAHPEVAAEPGTDHLARAITELGTMPDGTPRRIDLLIDALVPAWIERDPSIAGRGTDGKPARYLASATALHEGPVGDRFVELARELALRYKPDQITFTELMFDDETFGSDDLALYRRMTGEADWPRTDSGRVDEDSPKIGAWRSQVLTGLLSRVRQALDEVTGQVGHRVQLAQDVQVNWDEPGAGRPDAGHDYAALWQVVDRVVPWVYFDGGGRELADVTRLVAGLAAAAPGADRYTISIGLWGPEGSPVIAPTLMAESLRAARLAKATSLNVTPVSLMTAEHWSALGGVWTPAP